MVIVLAALAGGMLTFFVTRGSGSGEKAASRIPASIQGPQVTVGGLIYNVTAIRFLDRNRQADAPYLVNKDAPPKGLVYIGIWLKVYNPSGKDLPIAPGYLLEPYNDAVQVQMQQSSESAYNLSDPIVPARGVVPVPGTTEAAGPTPGGLLLYWLSNKVIREQPFRLVIHTGTANGFIFLPKVPLLKGSGGGH